MSNEMFKMAIKINSDYNNYRIGDKVNVTDTYENSIIVGYMDIAGGGLLLKDALSDGDSKRHFWYITEVDPIR